MMMGTKKFGHSIMALMRLGNPTFGFMECWFPTLTQEGLDTQNQVGRQRSFGSHIDSWEILGPHVELGEGLALAMENRIHLFILTHDLLKVFTSTSSWRYTYITCLLRIVMKKLIRSDNCSISKFLHALWMHEMQLQQFIQGLYHGGDIFKLHSTLVGYILQG